MLQGINLACERGEQPVFSGVNFTAPAGHALQFVGDNGAGKTSLLQIVCGLLQPSRGQLLWQAQDVTQQWPEFRSQFTFIGHQPGIRLRLSVEENLQLACQLAQHPAQRSLSEVIARLGLQADTLAAQLSFGQKRRLALAKLLLWPAKLWILDEPFNGLDAKAVHEWYAHLSEHLQAGGIVLFTSHQAVAISGQITQQVVMSA